MVSVTQKERRLLRNRWFRAIAHTKQFYSKELCIGDAVEVKNSSRRFVISQVYTPEIHGYPETRYSAYGLAIYKGSELEKVK